MRDGPPPSSTLRRLGAQPADRRRAWRSSSYGLRLGRRRATRPSRSPTRPSSAVLPDAGRPGAAPVPGRRRPHAGLRGVLIIDGQEIPTPDARGAPATANSDVRRRLDAVFDLAQNTVLFLPRQGATIEQFAPGDHQARSSTGSSTDDDGRRWISRDASPLRTSGAARARLSYSVFATAAGLRRPLSRQLARSPAARRSRPRRGSGTPSSSALVSFEAPGSSPTTTAVGLLRHAAGALAAARLDGLLGLLAGVAARACR